MTFDDALTIIEEFAVASDVAAAKTHIDGARLVAFDTYLAMAPDPEARDAHRNLKNADMLRFIIEAASARLARERSEAKTPVEPMRVSFVRDE